MNHNNDNELGSGTNVNNKMTLDLLYKSKIKELSESSITFDKIDKELSNIEKKLNVVFDNVWQPAKNIV